MMLKPQSLLVLLLLLAASIQSCEAQIPPFVCGIIKFLGKILIGCPNESILCLFAEIFFDVVCSPEPTASLLIEADLNHARS
ncbi:hypothetical protein RRG08_039580 [Elysia crispata]|uniref:Uncharacterized protein n=1 Tax=Elysia crispata TaxID=231223 RepID=A0AAE1AYZ5_9GAST|nr:hypothetical protein RRG08_039580 [Elysia crispata]